MTWLSDYYGTTIGKKMAMAVTGLILFAYALFHMAGNLQLYVPSPPNEAPGYFINRYAEFLHSTTFAPFLWIVRLVLLGSVALHVVAAIQLTVQSWGARGVRYHVRHYRKADIAARTMIWTGPIVGAFLTYHILHLTTGHVAPAGFVEGRAYENLVAGFRNPAIAGVYVAAVAMLGFHFYHALWSWFQTLGLAHPTHNASRRWFSTGLTVVVVLGDLSFPVAVLTGLVGGK
jgi:succinate dehydrogenase / fumarate reductase cytochrome b subunit